MIRQKDDDDEKDTVIREKDDDDERERYGDERER